jgi:hypothetical protein
MALGPIVAWPYRRSAPFRHCTRLYVDQLLVHSGHHALSGISLLFRSNRCVFGRRFAPPALGEATHRWAADGNVAKKTAPAEACAAYSYENTFGRSEQAAPRSLCGQPPDQESADAVHVDTVKVVRTELPVVFLTLQHVLGNLEQYMGCRHDRALGSPPSAVTHS